MGRSILRVVFLGLTLLAVAVPSSAAKPQTFSGTYDWSDGGSDQLVAEFRSTGQGQYKVTFRFRWSGERRSWKGRAEGSLEDGGTIDGTAGWSGRTWRFTATVDGDTIRGAHVEMKPESGDYPTGTFELRRARAR